MAKRSRIICSTLAASIYERSSYSVYDDVTTNTLAKFPVWVSASALFILWELATLGWGTISDSTDITAQASIQAHDGVAYKGAGPVALASVAMPKGYTYKSSSIAAAVSPGDELHVMTFATATTAGKKVTGTRFITTTEGGEAGAALSPKLIGDTIAAGLGSPAQKYGFTPAGIGAKSTVRGILILGHSLAIGIGGRANDGWGQSMGRLAGLPVLNIGKGGSLPSAMGDSANWDIAQYTGVAFVMWSINAINAWANDGANAATAESVFVTGHKADLLPKIKRLLGMGLKVVMCTEGFCGDGSTPAKNIATRAAWNAYVRANYSSYFGAHGVFDVSPALETATDNHTPKTGLTADLHWGEAGHDAVGVAGAAAISGSLSALFTGTVDGYVESGHDLFWGASTAVGTAPSGWLAAANGATKMHRSGTGALAITGGGTTSQYCIYQSAAITTNSQMEVTSYPWPSASQMNSPSGGQGLVVGLHPVATYQLGASGANKGYDIWVKFNEFRIYRIDAASTFVKQVFFSSNIVAGDTIQIVVYRTVNGSNQNVLDVHILKNGVQCHTTSSYTDTSTPAGWDVALYPSVGTRGDSSTSHPDGSVIDSVFFFTYDPTVIGLVASTATDATVEVVPGMRLPVSALVLDDSSVPADGQTVVATSDTTGVTIGGTSETDATGTALFTDASGLNVASTVAVGTTATITFAVGDVEGTLTVSVVAALSSDGSGGIGDGNEMTISETVTKAVTPAWSEVVDGTSASISGKSFMIGFASRSNVIEWRVGTSTPTTETGDEVRGDDSPKSDTVAASKKLYVRAKDGNSFNIVVHLSA